MTSSENHDHPQLALPENQNNGRTLSRSPHPYFRRSVNLVGERETATTNTQVQDQSESSSDRGTEADDEKGAILRGLPAPPLRARKGLRGSKTPLDSTPAISPLQTPSLAEDGPSYFFSRKKHRDKIQKVQGHRTRDTELYQKYIRRRQGEVVRRCTEFILLAVIGVVACKSAISSGELQKWSANIYSAFLGLAVLYAAYPFRSAMLALRDGFPFKAAFKKGFHIPSRFDPGPLLYPVFLPFFISVSLIEMNDSLIITNMVIGLSSIPTEILSVMPTQTSMLAHWAFSLLPLMGSQLKSFGSKPISSIRRNYQLDTDVTAEMCSLLFPLHQTLLMTLKYLTATSLDPAELHLLSAGLINVFLFALSPQAQILKALMWLGGLSLFIFCQTALSWEISLARIPAWKFVRNKSPKTGLLSTLERVLTNLLPRHKYRATARDDSDDEDYEHLRSARDRVKANVKQRGTQVNTPSSDLEPMSSQRQHDRRILEGLQDSPVRSATMPVNFNSAPSPSRQRRRSAGSSKAGLSSLTFTQAQALRWAIAGYTYIAALVIVLTALRYYIGAYALRSQEPFGWALGYLFGNIPQLRFWAVSNNWDTWVRLPDYLSKDDMLSDAGWVEVLRQTRLGAANTRLVLMGYCLLVLAVGIGTVLHLGTVVEVDTRRKVFHGIMVAMMLPTIPIDPCFIALALILILAVFLLLDLFRASQLPPISKPLTSFLAPYVDGRDYRGPVIVSHIFLLVGCAIPLWLSLAGVQRAGRGPWAGWETAGREVSMVSGVICVGMGDAAASLIGRRYGKTKWFWGGGKSLEGSFAFAVAVTIGLMASYLWLRIGGWAVLDVSALATALMKAVIAALGASLLESVLTAANDNVVVPVGLWLLVRGLDM